jgi:carboxymethylenebutenolidase
MNKILLLPISLFFLSFFQIFAPKPSSQKLVLSANTPMCHDIYVDDMRDFALDPAFQSLHSSPQLIDFQGNGEMMAFPTADGKLGSAYFLKAKKKSKKWLFVYQEWWGLNDNIKQQADIYYRDLGEKVNVIAIDMYDGNVTTDPKEAGKLMSEAKESRLENIVNGAIAFAGKKAKIANVGWCFGGSWSLKSALLGGKQTVGSVMYYGMPVRDVAKLKTLNCDVLGLFANEKYISKEIIEDFATKMKEADKGLKYKIFDAVHGFANPSNAKHDPEKSKEAYEMALTYLKEKLKL